MSQTVDEGGILDKDPTEQRVWPLDWGARALADGVTISGSSWTIEDTDATTPESPALLTYDNNSISADGRTTQARFKVGTAGRKYKVTNTIVTAESPPQTIDGVFYVRVKVKK